MVGSTQIVSAETQLKQSVPTNALLTIATIKKELQEVCEWFIFEPNDDVVRDRIHSAMHDVLRKYKNSGLIYHAVVICDHTNNPSYDDTICVTVGVAMTETGAYTLIDMVVSRLRLYEPNN